ncbi:thiamine pyrophosphate-dependent enzyme [Stenotrophomonas sp. S11A1a]|uniref:thiamine pyrophosphate-dependent enzyme n=1 Tax=Stenotrophomonas sp. S11A1a TaxID=3455011 RepID=UPI003F7A7B26
MPGNVGHAIRALRAAFPSPKAHQDAWRKRCAQHRDRFAARYDAPGQHISAPALLKRLGGAPADAVIACDVGQHQMWVAQHCRFNHPRNHLTSGALGTMGFVLPAAMGAQFACPDRTVVLVSGDGSFMMNVQELATIARCRLPVNRAAGQQFAGHGAAVAGAVLAERYSEIDLSDNPDFVALAQVFGIAATRIGNRDDVEGGLAALLAEPGPALLHVAIDARANVWPLVPPNTAQHDAGKQPRPRPPGDPQCNTGLTWCCTRPKARCCA